MKPKLNEEKRQLLRKENEKSSRLLDNYYNPNIHKKIWEPAGSIKSKTNYVYGDSGLSYNIIDSSLSKEKNIEQIHFLEFDFLEENDIIIIIEYYSNNSKNFNQTNYFRDVYKNLAKLLQLCITTRFPFIKTILKPTDMNIKMNRAGAFEIQLGMKLNGHTQIINLFSKLKSGQWPNFKNILHKINSHMPILSFKFQVYDKDEGENSESTVIESSINESKAENNKNDLFRKPSKYENIKINIYEYNHEMMDKYFKEAQKTLDFIYNAKKRKEILLTENSGTIDNNETINKINLNNTNNSFNLNVSNNTLFKKGDIIEDLSILDKLKGKLLCAGYTDRLGFLYFENVPYDSYLIEVETNNKFLGLGYVIQFKKIYRTQKDKNYTFSKIFGLKRQNNAFLEVYLFSNEKKDDKIEINFIKGAKISLKKIGNNSETFELREKIKGKYEIITEPREFEIKVSINGKEVASKEINLNSGLNKINFEL